MRRIRSAFFFAVGVAASVSLADPPRSVVESMDRLQLAGVIRSAIGVTRRETEIPCFITSEDLDLQTPKTRVLLVGGLDGSVESVTATINALKWFYQSDDADSARKKFAVSAVPCINPDGIAAGKGPGNLAGGDPAACGFPPSVNFYGDAKDSEAAYLWRWIQMHAPDAVVEVNHGPRTRWLTSEPLDEKSSPLSAALKSSKLADENALTTALQGPFAALRVELEPGAEFLPQLLAAIETSGFSRPSRRRMELRKLAERSPAVIGQQLAEVYGRDLPDVTYIPAVAVIGRMRLGKEYVDDANRAARPYFTGDRPTKPGSPVSLAGHLVFAELARAAQEPTEADRYVQLARAAGDAAFDEKGKVDLARLSSSQMSDAMFMAGPILARVGALTGELRYFDACAAHIRHMRKMVRRDDGLYRHWPGVEAAWGRGNGFPALGLAMCLTDFPASHPARSELLDAYREHMAVLGNYQDPTGCWHQVIDKPGSYRELTCTCMIGFSMLRGIRRGWLPKDEYQPIVDRAWNAVKQRVAADGSLVDVCTGTGKQKDLRAYYDRTAILGRDGRGGAMALLFVSEMLNSTRGQDCRLSLRERTPFRRAKGDYKRTLPLHGACPLFKPAPFLSLPPFQAT